jgi:predicted DNA-binding transcriptional regulator YafY
MDYITYTEKLNYLLEMIEKGRLTSLQQAAEKFDCSKRTIRRMINTLRKQGYPIKYNRVNKKYFIES